MDGLCTWGEDCTYAGTQVCSCTCGDWRPPWSIILSPHPMFWQGCPLHLELPNWLDRLVSKSSNFPVSSFQCAITEAYHHAQFFLWGPGFQSLVFIPKKGTILSPSHLSSPHALFSTLKMLIHCFFLCIVFHKTIRRNRFLVKGESSPATVWQLQAHLL